MLPARTHAATAPGIDLSRQRLLRLGVMLYGLRLTLQEVGHIGLVGITVDAVMLLSTYAVVAYVGTRWLALDATTSMLIGAGSSICGAAAVMATAPVVRSRPEQAAVAVATVVVFGTAAIFLYPALYELNRSIHFIPGGGRTFSLYIGSTVHDVAQVLAAGHAVGNGAEDAALVAKMVRVMMLAPFLVTLSIRRSKSRGTAAASGPSGGSSHSLRGVPVPWFAFGFIAFVGLNSLRWLPPSWVAASTRVDNFLLATAMAALGLSTDVGMVRKAGAKPLVLGAIAFVWLVLAGAVVNRFAG